MPISRKRRLADERQPCVLKQLCAQLDMSL
jgi:hypothetical protein